MATPVTVTVAALSPSGGGSPTGQPHKQRFGDQDNAAVPSARAGAETFARDYAEDEGGNSPSGLDRRGSFMDDARRAAKTVVLPLMNET